MRALEEDYWWFQGRHRILMDSLRPFLVNSNDPSHSKAIRYLDVGCGTGMLLENLQSVAWTSGLDASPVALAYCKGRNLRNILRGDAVFLPIRNNSYDVISAIDVIEHVDDEKGLVREIFRLLKPQGIAIMTVPAHQRLWSPHDVALHHKRRYEKNDFLRLIKGAGFVPLKYTYLFASVCLPVMIYRFLRRRLARPGAVSRTDEFPLPKIVNALLRQSVYAEARWLKRHNLPCGTSLLCVASKPKV